MRLPTPVRIRVCSLVSAAALLACEDSTKGGGDPQDAAPYRNGRDQNTIELPDFGEAPPLGDAAAAPPGPDGLVFIDGSTVPVSDAGDPPPPPPDDDARVAPPPPEPDAGEDPTPPPPDPDAGVEPPPDDACARALAAANYDFESGPQGFSHDVSDGTVAPDWPLDPWEHGRATSGPGACFEGRQCWATDLDDNLTQCQRAELISPVVDLSACAGRNVTLVFDHWYDFWAGQDDFGDIYYDGGLVEMAPQGRDFAPLGGGADYPGEINISPSAGFGYDCLDPDAFHVDRLPGYVQQSGGWEEARLALGADAGRFTLRWAFATGANAQTFDPIESQLYEPPGWYIDHVRFVVR